MASARHPSNYLPSVVGNDVRHQISVAPTDHTGIHISDLEEVVHGEITGSTAVSTNLSKSFRRTDNRAWRSLSCLELRPGRSDALTRVSCKPRGQSSKTHNNRSRLDHHSQPGSEKSSQLKGLLRSHRTTANTDAVVAELRFTQAIFPVSAAP